MSLDLLHLQQQLLLPRPPHGVAVLGFSDVERGALATSFRLGGVGNRRYVQVVMLTRADCVVADADHLPSVQLVLATERLGDTVFIGQHRPHDAVAWLPRPINALHVTQALDALVAAREVRVDEVPAVPPAKVAPAASVVLQAPVSPVASGGSEALDMLQADATPAMGGAPDAASTQPRALIVDHSPADQRFLQARLEPWGLVADRAASSGQAIALMRRHSYDLVFVDLALGPSSELDGLALCQHIKRSASALHALVIVVSAHHNQMDRVRGALAGCDGYLAKPLDPAELRRLLLRQGLKAPEPQEAVCSAD